MLRRLESWVDSNAVTLLRYNLQTVFYTPILAGVIAAWVLGDSAQLREVYVGIIESPHAPHSLRHAVLGLAGLTILSALIFVSSYLLGTWRIDTIYPRHASIRLDRWLRTLRVILAVLSSMLPFAGLLLGLYRARAGLESAERDYAEALVEVGKAANLKLPLSDLPQGLDVELRLIGLAMLAVVLIAIGHAVVLVAMRRSSLARHAVLWVAGAIALLLAAGPFLLMPDQAVAVARVVGPLAAISGVLVAIYGVLLLLSYLNRVTGAPLIGILALTIIAAGMLQLSRRQEADGSARIEQATIESFRQSELIEARRSGNDLEEGFNEWLRSRKDYGAFRARGKPYPVFIFAAQGGGLYAATAIARTMMELQRDCPAFVQHVFAISAVSGGAVGSAIVHAEAAGSVPQEANTSAPPDCQRAGGGDFRRLESIVLEDHLSPIVGTFISDLVRKLPYVGFSKDSVTRSTALESSIKTAFDDAGDASPAGECGPAGLGAPYLDHWCTRSSAPALILNSTWVENGHRVAFAPFGLEQAGDYTLHSFKDFAKEVSDAKDISLVEAVVISARYPGVLSSRQFAAKLGSGQDATLRKWNFVDGGYADASGAATALQVFNALNQLIENGDRAEEIDLRLVLVTDTEGDQSLAELNGTGFSDTWAPFSALLNIRALLSSQAVTQAVARGAALDRAMEGASSRQGAGPRVMVMGLDRKSFGLSIGWRMSRATYDTVRLLIGDRALCTAQAQGRLEGSRAGLSPTARTVLHNSCVAKTLLDLVAMDESPG